MADLERVIDLEGYYPDFLRDLLELKLSAQTAGEEVRRLYQGIDSLWADGFIQTATIQGVKRWESILQIRPYPGDSLEERKADILLKWNQQLPYTILRLIERLNASVGEKNYELYVRHKEYVLELIIIDETYRVLCSARNMTREMIPANLLFIFAALYPMQIPVDITTSSRMRLMSDFYARYNREFLYLDGTWLLDGTYLLNGYKEAEALELYPARMTVFSGYDVPCHTAGGSASIASIRAAPDIETALRMQGSVEEHAAVGSRMSTGTAASACPGTDFHLRVENDLWYLDGTYLLDGTKLLDAEIFEYDL